ncbi:flagellar hook-basal body complex protein FliE [Amphiplicatus metriothermophilus]|uniref:Flagellar hook-basal body complex protein FliE n=1 Tax=Amphiplicatus metriothermophilus TaxID=1519374 RepID=A0A239PKI3_9PROT|nr:flagellar hook-basal body complex protein FliE [Amphiplicatus metriothermophilus]MBB5517332.1 flagellar hook-basal body complex protein FliE [Amphiplicatus metriothermophilus]SNT68332.1 flagellar hook-basal body complex protein FliE [Amphiplicatus metriothermophilus]
MDVNAFNAARTYGAARELLGGAQNKAGAGLKAGAQAGSTAGDGGFKPAELVKDFAETVAKSEAVAADFMAGKADPHSVVEALAAAELAVETAVTLRNQVIEAYQELMRMPV